jgi:hypothetical protein
MEKFIKVLKVIAFIAIGVLLVLATQKVVTWIMMKLGERMFPEKTDVSAYDVPEEREQNYLN